MLRMPLEFKYCPRYCEENIWHLAQEPALAESERVVALISNEAGACLFWNQRIAEGPGLPVWWDYHVVLLARHERWYVYDLDTALPLPAPAETYFDETFPMEGRIPVELRPRFALIEGDDFVASFGSDRSHMQDAVGNWLAPPPEWPRINPARPGNFLEFVERQFRTPDHRSLAEVRQRFADCC